MEYLAIPLGAAALGLAMGWFAEKSIDRRIVPVVLLALGLIAAAYAYYLTFVAQAALAPRGKTLTVAIASLAAFIASSGFLFYSRPKSAVMFGAVASMMFVATLPLTGIFLACALIAGCP